MRGVNRATGTTRPIFLYSPVSVLMGFICSAVALIMAALQEERRTQKEAAANPLHCAVRPAVSASEYKLIVIKE